MKDKGKNVTHTWLNENAPVGTVVLDPLGVDFVRLRNMKWSSGSDSFDSDLLGVYEGYEIVRWGFGTQR